MNSTTDTKSPLFAITLICLAAVVAYLWMQHNPQDNAQDAQLQEILALRNEADNFTHWIAGDGSDSLYVNNPARNIIFEDFSPVQRDRIHIGRQYRNWEEVKANLYFDGFDTLLVTKDKHFIVLRGFRPEEIPPEAFVYD